jgi:hypothetical protein
METHKEPIKMESLKNPLGETSVGSHKQGKVIGAALPRMHRLGSAATSQHINERVWIR